MCDECLLIYEIICMQTSVFCHTTEVVPTHAIASPLVLELPVVIAFQASQKLNQCKLTAYSVSSH